MRFFLLKCQYAIEIGANLAYVGHYAVSNDPNVKAIAEDEIRHQEMIKDILSACGHKTNKILNGIMYLVGHSVRLSCYVFPKFSLDIVASTMEKFNIVSYGYLAEQFPYYEDVLLAAKENEESHERYFKSYK